MSPAVKSSPRILHSSPMEEKKLGFPFSENGPSAIQGEGATLAFSDLRVGYLVRNKLVASSSSH